MSAGQIPVRGSSAESRLAENWRRTLSAVPTVLGRLAYLASLRNVNSGVYEHFGLAQRAGAERVDALLRRSHADVFGEWLSFGLPRQKEELDQYLGDAEGERSEIVANWVSLAPYAAWIPTETRDVERELFQSDLEILLDMLRTELGVAARDPDL